MNRRSFLTPVSIHRQKSGGDRQIAGDRQAGGSRQNISPYANKTLPRVARTTSGLEPYTGPWGYDQAAHLLRRTLFGADYVTFNAMAANTMQQIVSQLLQDQPAPAPPVNVNSKDVDVPIGQTWVFSPLLDSNGYNPNSSRILSLKAWWIGQMLNQGVSLVEKMTLLWHNHLATETSVIGDARFCYKHNALLRQFALGNLKELVYQVTIDPGMLIYLNGSTNTASHPNENYGRELQELFTIGKGVEIAPGDYTYYTETDVQEAAKVLTGWQVNQTTISSVFNSTRHDASVKQFSGDYQNTIILGKLTADRPNEIDDLLTMIFNEVETAKFFARKLYRWFVYYLIDDTVEANVIAPLAGILQSNNYEVKPALQALLSSAHFYDPVNIGCVIKNPVDHAVGTCRLFGVGFPGSTDVIDQYAMWSYLRTEAAVMQLDPGDPPNVAGWPEYYQEPQFYELWINTDTLPVRNQFTDTMILRGHTSNGNTSIIDPIAFVEQLSDPGDPNLIVTEFARLLFPIQLTSNQMAFLKETLLPGLPDYEWTVEWTTYTQDPTNTTKLNAVKSKLQALLKFMMEMPEYQLM